MSVVSEQTYETTRVKYFTASKVLVVEGEKLEGVDGLFADTEILIDSALFDYRSGELAMDFNTVVLLKPEKKIYDTAEGLESIYIVHMIGQESIQSFSIWRPGQLIGSILQMIGGEEEYDNITLINYNAGTKEVTLYPAEGGFIELDNIEVLDLSGQIGKDSIIMADSLYLYSPSNCLFRVTLLGTRLEISSRCGESS